MKVRASLKKRTPECKIVRRNGRLYVINKKILSINNVKDNLLFLQKIIKYMAIRIVGVDLPQNKRGEIALTYVYGIGRSSSAKILDKAGVDKDLKVKDWTDDQAAKIREIIGAEYKVEGDLRSEIQLNIKRLMDIGCYRGVRHRIGLPVRGQSTKNNARTRKGRKKTVANKKKLLNNNC